MAAWKDTHFFKNRKGNTMFKVVCIDDSHQISEEIPFVKKGNIYNVIDTIFNAKDTAFFEKLPNVVSVRGEYYMLAETGNEAGFHSSMFIKINEQEIDETEMIRESKTILQ